MLFKAVLVIPEGKLFLRPPMVGNIQDQWCSYFHEQNTRIVFEKLNRTLLKKHEFKYEGDIRTSGVEEIENETGGDDDDDDDDDGGFNDNGDGEIDDDNGDNVDDDDDDDGEKNSGDCDGNRVDGVTANGDVSNIKYLIGET